MSFCYSPYFIFRISFDFGNCGIILKQLKTYSTILYFMGMDRKSMKIQMKIIPKIIYQLFEHGRFKIIIEN